MCKFRGQIELYTRNPTILHGVQNSETGYMTLTTPLSGKIFLRQGLVKDSADQLGVRWPPKWRLLVRLWPLSSGLLRTTLDLGPVADPPKPSYFRPPPDRIPGLPSLFPLEMAPSSQVGLSKRTLMGAQRSSLNSKILKAYKLIQTQFSDRAPAASFSKK